MNMIIVSHSSTALKSNSGIAQIHPILKVLLNKELFEVDLILIVRL